MIAHIRGEVAEIGPDYAVIDTQGVGFLLHCSSATLGTLKHKSQARLHTYMQVREDAMLLYGFATAEEKNMFSRLITVSGVGPKVALSALSTLSANQLAIAIATGDAGAFNKVNGVGKKIAQRIILELKEKIAQEEKLLSPALNSEPAAKNEAQEAITALMALGYSLSEAAQAIKGAPEGTLEDTIRYALKRLAM